METRFLIVGAGPFGLSMAAYAEHLGLDYLMLGVPMGFWKSNMPAGMLLRSTTEWHLDPVDRHSIQHYLESRGGWPHDDSPLSLGFYLDYARWFQEKKGIEATPGFLTRLDVDETGRFRAQLDDGETITARAVLLATGFRAFAYEPPEARRILPVGRYEHTCTSVDLEAHRGERVIIVGGRQSAFEWAALLHEAGAADVHVVHRHPTPRFEESNWTWVRPIVEAMVDDPGWYRRLAPQEQDELDRRFWEEGRLKLEPWLEDRIHTEGITLWPDRTLDVCEEDEDGTLRCRLSDGTELEADHIILATGYRTDLHRLDYLASGNLLQRIAMDEGKPILDTSFQTTVPGLYFTSMPATRDFGSFFAFTISARTSAQVIGNALAG